MKKSEKSKKYFSYIIFIISICLAALAWFYGARPFIVNGNSMYPTFNKSFADSKKHFPAGEYIFIDLFTYAIGNDPERYDVVVTHSPVENNLLLLKRIIGLPGETIQINNTDIFITDVNGNVEKLDEPYLNHEQPIVYTPKTLKLGDEQYFVMGDNRLNSFDSRYWGALDKNLILGRILLRLYPFNQIKLFPGKLT